MEFNNPTQPETKPTARQRAEQYGIDMSLIDTNLQKTPYERLQNHNQAIKLARALQKAMKRHLHD